MVDRFLPKLSERRRASGRRVGARPCVAAAAATLLAFAAGCAGRPVVADGPRRGAEHDARMIAAQQLAERQAAAYRQASAPRAPALDATPRDEVVWLSPEDAPAERPAATARHASPRGVETVEVVQRSRPAVRQPGPGPDEALGPSGLTVDEEQRIAEELRAMSRRPISEMLDDDMPLDGSPEPPDAPDASEAPETATAPSPVNGASDAGSSEEPELAGAAGDPDPLPAPSSEELLTLLVADAAKQGNAKAVERAVRIATLKAADPARQLEESDLDGLTPPQQRAVRQYMQVIRSLATRLVEGEARLDADALREDIHALADPPALEIRHAALCRQVRGFGVYDAFASHQFRAGVDQRMIVYVEVDRFQSQLSDEGVHEVRLAQELVLYNDSDGLAVWRQPRAEIVDRSRNRRRDFFVVQLITLPASLGVGKYRLKATLEDLHGGTIAETILPVDLVSDPALVRGDG